MIVYSLQPSGISYYLLNKSYWDIPDNWMNKIIAHLCVSRDPDRVQSDILTFRVLFWITRRLLYCAAGYVEWCDAVALVPGCASIESSNRLSVMVMALWPSHIAHQRQEIEAASRESDIRTPAGQPMYIIPVYPVIASVLWYIVDCILQIGGYSVLHAVKLSTLLCSLHCSPQYR